MYSTHGGPPLHEAPLSVFVAGGRSPEVEFARKNLISTSIPNSQASSHQHFFSSTKDFSTDPTTDGSTGNTGKIDAFFEKYPACCSSIHPNQGEQKISPMFGT